MMKWNIPAKTFLVGEYAALQGLESILLTTSPCFTLEITEEPGLNGIHPQSPAGLWWLQQELKQGVKFTDPYLGRGGFGASSAQFAGCYRAYCALHNKEENPDEMLDYYFALSWNGQGIKPSGYDLLAQTQKGLVYLNHSKVCMSYQDWPLEDLDFMLVHTGMKLATHTHLEKARLHHDFSRLGQIAHLCQEALSQKDGEAFIASIQACYQELLSLQLVAEHTQHLIEFFLKQDAVYAAKGCGAMGSDILLLIMAKDSAAHLTKGIREQGLSVFATKDNLLK